MGVDTAVCGRDETVVGMGQIAAGRGTTRLRAVLGSCIGLAVYDPQRHVGALAHIVLPSSCGRKYVAPGKFADTAIPEMLEMLQRMGGGRDNLVAKFAGGASMFSASAPTQVGDANVQAVAAALQDAGIPLLAQEVNGNSGRRVTLDCATGQFTVETARGGPKVL